MELFMLAFIVGLAAQGLDVFDVHAREIGIVKFGRWRKKSTGDGRRLPAGRLASLGYVLAGALLLIGITLALAHWSASSPETGLSLAVMGMGMGVPQLEQKFEEARAAAHNLVDRYTDGGTREPNSYEQGLIEQKLQEAKTAKGRLEKARSDAAMLGQIEDMTGGVSSRFSAAGGVGARGSFGAQFVSSGEFQNFLKLGGRRGTRWSTGVIDLRSELLDSDAGSPGSGGDLIVPDYRPGVVQLPTRRLTIADLLAQGTTSSNVVAYMKETLFANNADTVSEGALKPESALRFDQASDPVQVIAHWLPVTEQMLEDVPALRAYLDARLRLGVLLAEENKLLNGAASPDEITGILNRDGLAASVVSGGSPEESNADAIARQIGAIENDQQVQVDGIVMNPTDFLNIQLSKTSSDEYYGDGPFATPSRATLWGRAVVLTPLMTQGTALVGAFRTGAQLFRKGPIRVELSNSHDDYFVRNLIAIRAEERVALAVYRPAAFGTVTGL